MAHTSSIIIICSELCKYLFIRRHRFLPEQIRAIVPEEAFEIEGLDGSTVFAHAFAEGSSEESLCLLITSSRPDVPSMLVTGHFSLPNAAFAREARRLVRAHAPGGRVTILIVDNSAYGSDVAAAPAPSDADALVREVAACRAARQRVVLLAPLLGALPAMRALVARVGGRAVAVSTARLALLRTAAPDVAAQLGAARASDAPIVVVEKPADAEKLATARDVRAFDLLEARVEALRRVDRLPLVCLHPPPRLLAEFVAAFPAVHVRGLYPGACPPAPDPQTVPRTPPVPEARPSLQVAASPSPGTCRFQSAVEEIFDEAFEHYLTHVPDSARFEPLPVNVQALEEHILGYRPAASPAATAASAATMF